MRRKRRTFVCDEHVRRLLELLDQAEDQGER